MRILVDADACNRIGQIESIAKKNHLEVILFCDTSRLIRSSYSQIKIVSRGQDAADFCILNNCREGDIVITNDTGLASLVMVKKGIAINTHGLRYTEQNITGMLIDRYYRSQAQRKQNRQRGKAKHCRESKNYKNIYSCDEHNSFGSTLIDTIVKERKNERDKRNSDLRKLQAAV